jgi:hypothetical protein
MNQPKEEIIKKFIAAYNSFDIDSMLLLLHSEVQFKNISNGEVNVQTAGKDEFRKLAKQSATIFKEREQKIVLYKETDNKINVEIQYRAILALDLPGELESGEYIDMHGKSEYIFKDGLIVSIIDES